MTLATIFLYVTLGSSALRAVLAGIRPLFPDASPIDKALAFVDEFSRHFSSTVVDRVVPGVDAGKQAPK